MTLSETDGRRVFAAAARGFGYQTADDADLVWGRERRTVGALVHRDGDLAPAWLRLIFAAEPGGKLWTGTFDAEMVVPGTVRRPRLLKADQTSDASRSVRAELMTYIPEPVLSPSPDLSAPDPSGGAGVVGGLPGSWWEALDEALAAVAATAVPSWREPVVSAEHVAQTILRYLGVEVDPDPAGWLLAHGDLHWANLTGEPLAILGWEGFGPAPAGFDAAALYAYSLADPSAARTVRETFAAQLEGPSGWLAELLVAAMILQAAERDPVHARLAALVHEHARALITVRQVER